MSDVENVAETLAEYERLAIKTGAKVQIMPPEFTADGEKWSPLWLANEPPAAARATVFRDNVQTDVIATWRESLPLETSLTSDGRRWCDIWERKPMQRLGSYVLRAALSRAFRDAIGDRHEPEDDVPRIAGAQPWDAGLDWDEAISAAPNVVELDEIWDQARAARARTGAREKAYKDRRAALVAGDWRPPAPPLSPEEAVRDRAFDAAPDMFDAPFASVSARSTSWPDIRMPQDHKPPQNRAQRRKGKGRR